MIEAHGDLWDFPADVRVITTNGATRKDGAAVMGRGVALQATQRYPEIAFELGQCLWTHGLKVMLLPCGLIAFPVKYHWREEADIDLIERSANELVKIIDNRGTTGPDGWQTVALPRPGCGNGRLCWEDVKPVIAPILDDRFVVVQK